MWWNRQQIRNHCAILGFVHTGLLAMIFYSFLAMKANAIAMSSVWTEPKPFYLLELYEV